MRYYLGLIQIFLLLLVSSCGEHTVSSENVLNKVEEVLKEVEQLIDSEEKSDSVGLEEKSDSVGLEEKLASEDLVAQKDLRARPSFKELTLVSWNIQHLGRTKNEEEIWEMAQILRYYDVVAIQEVVAKDPAGAQAVARLADALNRTGTQWDYQVSDPTKSPSSNISERYAFLWKTSKLAIQKRAFLDSERQDDFYREPFVAAFKSLKTNKVFYVANYHSRKYSDQPQEEIIHLLDYSERWDTPYMLIAGDFNTPETDAVWDAFYENGYKSALKGVRTTLKMKCAEGVYTNHPIDNIYYTPGVKKHQANSIDFVKSCENLEHARQISDHLPVFLEFSLE